MTTPLSTAVLLLTQTADQIFDAAIAVARIVGLPVDTWRVGDPTRALYRSQGEHLAALDEVQAQYAAGNFLLSSEGAMKTLRAKDVYNVDREEETFAAPTVDFENEAGGYYEIDTAGLTVSSSVTGATFHNQSPVIITPLSTLAEVLFIAEEGGAAGTVGVDEIDTIVSPTLTGVVIIGSAAAIGSDEQSDPGLDEQCLATLGALSPAGPADAYEFVARNSDLTGVTGITRTQSDGDTADGTVTVYVATATAGVDGPTVTAIQAACDEWAQPQCTDATVVSGAPETLNFTITLSPTQATAQTALEQAIDAFLIADVSMGGTTAVSAIVAVVHATLAGSGLVSVPTVLINGVAADVEHADGIFPVRGTLVLA